MWWCLLQVSSLVGKNRTKQLKSLISTLLFLSPPPPILPLWIFSFSFSSSLSCKVRVQLEDKGIETGSSLPLCQTIWLYTAVISPLYLSPSTGLCDELKQESSPWAPVCACEYLWMCVAMFCVWIVQNLCSPAVILSETPKRDTHARFASVSSLFVISNLQLQGNAARSYVCSE